MTLAAAAREAVRRHPFVHEGLRAGVVNYTAAARFLDVNGDEDAIVAALRRYADELPAVDETGATARVEMQSGLEATANDQPLLAVGDTRFGQGSGSFTGLLATGDVDADALGQILGRLSIDGVDATAAGVAGHSLVVVVERRDGPDALRIVEDVLRGDS